MICFGGCFCLFCYVFFLVLGSLTWVLCTKLCWYCWVCHQGRPVLWQSIGFVWSVVQEQNCCRGVHFVGFVFRSTTALTRFSVAGFAFPLTPQVRKNSRQENVCAVSSSALPCFASYISFSFSMDYTLLKMRLQIWGMGYFGNIISSLMLYPQVSESA